MTVDWADLGRSLERFSRATGLCVSGYDEGAVRRVGPLHYSDVARVLSSSGVWRGADGTDPARPESTGAVGAGQRIEAALVRRALDSGLPVREDVAGEIAVLGTPIVIGGAVRGALVYGWVFPSFGTPLGCQRLARVLGVDPARLWAAVRLTPPVPPARLAVLSELLETMMAAEVRHAEILETLDAMSRMREVFLAGVSHELRTPLSAIGLRIEVLLRSHDLPEHALAALRNMKQHVARQARLVEDLIEASRTRTGQLSLRLRTVSLDEVLAAALTATSPQAQAKGIIVTTHGLPDAADRRVRADPYRLEQVFWNLLSNAVKFTPSGGEITLAIGSDGTAHEVVVVDTGRGIEPELLPKVFEPFQRAPDANQAGLGLGLSIARGIVESHGGTLTAHSDGLGTGARFVVRLPLDSRESPA